jgi:hypothetical protein
MPQLSITTFEFTGLHGFSHRSGGMMGYASVSSGMSISISVTPTSVPA